MIKSKEALIPYLLLVAAVAGGLLWHESESLPRLGRTVSVGETTVGGPYALTDQDGRPRSSADFRGRFQLIYFGYSFCPDVCPTTLAVMSDALDKLGADANRIVPIFITVDPDRDTPKVMKQYVAAFGPRFMGLTGSQAALDKVEKEFRVYARKQPLEGGTYAMDHSSVVYLMGPDGRLVKYYNDPLSPDQLAKDLKSRL